jgi:hypothetical protein
LACGCANPGSKWGILRNGQDTRIPVEKPTTANLVESINQNARQIQSIQCTDVDIDCKMGNQPFGMQAKMACQKNRNFRLIATAVGNSQADLGSNDQEFWYWVAKGDPYLVYCSYSDLSRGLRLPFPFQPEWVMQALGMAEHDPNGNYTLKTSGSTLELVQQTVSLQGQPVQHVTVFDYGRDSRVRVRAHRLTDQQGREICSAYINDARVIGGAIVPTRVALVWPSERLELRMKLNNPVVNQLDPNSAGRLFTRPTIAGVQSLDLARALEGSRLSQVGGQATAPIRR